MKSKHRRWTFLVVGVWVLAMGLSMVMAPATADAKVDGQDMGWAVYTPNHPAGCAPYPFDCYVVWVWPDS